MTRTSYFAYFTVTALTASGLALAQDSAAQNAPQDSQNTVQPAAPPQNTGGNRGWRRVDDPAPADAAADPQADQNAPAPAQAPPPAPNSRPGYYAGQPAPPPNYDSQQGPPPNYQGAPPNYQGAPPNYQGAPPNYQGAPPNYQGAPPNYQGAPPNYQGAPPNYQGAPPNYQGAPPNYQGAPPNYQGARPNYQQGPQQAPAPMPPVPASLTIKPGTYITVRVNQVLSSDHNHPGDAFAATLVKPVVVDGVVVAARGQTIGGRVAEAKKAGMVEGTSRLGVQLTDLTLVDGQSLPINSQLITRNGSTSVGRDAGAIAGTTAVGAAAGAAADLGRGAAIGAGAGAFVGIVGVLLTRGHPTVIYPEQVLTFRVEAPVTVATDRAPQAFRYVEPGDYQQADMQRRPPTMRVAGPPAYYGPGYYAAPYYPYPYPYYYGPSFGVYFGSGYYRGWRR